MYFLHSSARQMCYKVKIFGNLFSKPIFLTLKKKVENKRSCLEGPKLKADEISMIKSLIMTFILKGKNLNTRIYSNSIIAGKIMARSKSQK